MIGNETDAALALADALPVLSVNGSTRKVYRTGDVVYKVNNGDYYYDANLEEFLTIKEAKSIANLADNVFIPETALHTVNGVNVIAMEYVEGTAVAECYCSDESEHDDTCMTNDVWEKVNGILSDPSGFNTIVKDNGDIYVIDFA